MTTVVAELYVALISAGVPEGKARAAAAAAAVAPRRDADQPCRTSDVPGHGVDRNGAAAAARLAAEMETLMWMTVVCLTGVIGLLIDAFAPR